MTTPAKPATPVKASPIKVPATPKKKDIMDDLISGAIGGDEDLQQKIDRSITRELEGVGVEIAGVLLRQLSMSAVMRLHHVGNEIMSGKQVKDMHNPLYAAAEVLYTLAQENQLEEVITAAFGPLEDWRMLVHLWAETVAPSENLISDVIAFINDSTTTRVKARLPKAMKGETASEGNDSPHRGLCD